MKGSSNFATTLLLITLVLVLLPETVHAFGAGDIPDFAFLNDKAFRHGDIENILSTLAKTAGHVAMSSGGGDLFGFAKSLIKSATSGPGGSKFTSGDIKKVYFGNWLRDYSQAMDIGGLSKLTAESLVLVVSVLGFMTFGFATEEFQVTPERLGVYLPVEHIDNPKGYGAKEGDPRQFHPKLRPPVNPRELEIDTRTGMKNYMASENQGWDTSTAHIRRVLIQCIEMGRRAQGRDGPELYEAYRLLGTGLHTLEDLLAHSNWVEIALRKMGHSEVFCHVGDGTDIETPNGRAPPLVTGTFGGADFLHSLMGEATDKLSQASVTDLATKMNQASEGDNSNVSTLKAILSKLPIGGGGGDKMQQGEDLHAASKAYNFDPDNIAPPEVQQQLMQLLKWRDGLMRSILEKIEMIPGLDELVDQLSNALNAYVYTVIAPWITPVLQQATSVLGEGSKAVINTEDQYEVFDSPRASDPSHSLLSKDHFGLILNEPAGKIAILVVEHSVKIIVQAWSDNGNPSQAVDAILEAFHHPYYATGRSIIQNAMFQEMERWLGGLGQDEARETINALTKDSVRNGKNKRLGSENENLDEPGYGGCGHGAQPQRKPQGQSQSQSQSYGSGGQQRQQQYGETQSSYSSGNTRQSEGYNSSSNEYSSSNDRTESYDRSGQSEEYSSSRRDEGNDEYSGGRSESHHHKKGHHGQESRRHDNDNEDSYGSRTQRDESSGYTPSYTQPEERSSEYGRTEESSYGGENEASGRGGSGYRRSEEQTYGGGNEYTSSGRGNSRYESGRTEEQSYGGRNESSGRGGSGYGRSEEQTYGGGNEYTSSGRGNSGNESGRTEASYGGGNEYASSGRGNSGYERSEERSYNSSSAQDSYASAGRGTSTGYGRTEESEYGRGEERGGSGYERSEESRGGGGGYGGGEENSYGRGQTGYGDRDETFGAERLSINENQGYDSESRGYEESQGYDGNRGGNEYESNY
ncbi:heterokaryon incompatibility protein Het-C-domain-containing protein [Mycena rosella]|uniref:Heterokaryon incompatibility protein Het-C-domain-containing protein n=1 Tax=Mycena rosella TaxID=1033263 RepID=A0AAD7CMU5_MYCRO|nr:heterokaryon incompatibility protein Het-C-domain-containing protein [Mycena rosella]